MKKHITAKLKTPEEVRAEFARKGIAVSAWARAHGLKLWAVRDVLRGHHKMMYGDGHKAAVLLGMKEGEIVDLPESVRKPVKRARG